MKTLTLALVVSVFLTPLGAAPAEPASRAVTLARAMRSDELAVSGAKRAFASRAVPEYANANLGCVKRVDYQDFTAKFARVIEQVLNAPEIETAIAFYQSSAGTKYVEGTIRRLRDSFGDDTGLPKIAGVEDISPAEREAIATFASSDLGRKIAGKKMTESPAALQFGREMIDEIGQKCSKSRK